MWRNARQEGTDFKNPKPGKQVAPERRAQDRQPIRLRVEYECLEDFLTDYSANLSVGGMFIETSRPLPLGTRFQLRFFLPGFEEPVDSRAEVRWVLDDGSAGPLPSGMGVCFEGMNDAQVEQIRALLESWSQS